MCWEHWLRSTQTRPWALVSWPHFASDEASAELVHSEDAAEEQLERQLEFQGAVSWLRHVMSALPGDHEASWGRSKNAYTSLYLVKCMLMTRLLPAYICTKQLCIDAVLALFPNLLAEPVAHILKQKHVFP